MSETSGYLAGELGRIAWRRVEGDGPEIVWLGGFNSDMTGTKAQALSDWAAATGRAFLRFDYFGHGASDGAFRDGTISRWRADALAVIDALTVGPLVLVGSSMGGWISCLAALSRPQRIAAMVLLAPAPDFTEKLMKPSFAPEVMEEIMEKGAWTRPSPYGDDGYPITRALLEDGARFRGGVEMGEDADRTRSSSNTAQNQGKRPEAVTASATDTARTSESSRSTESSAKAGESTSDANGSSKRKGGSEAVAEATA